MSLPVNWDNEEQTRVLVEFDEPLTWSTFHKTIERAHTLIGSVEHRVDLVIWDKVGLPKGSALAQFRSAFQSQPANTGRVFIVSEQPPFMMRFMRQLASIMQNIFPMKSKIVFAASIDETRKSADLVNSRVS